MLSLKFLFYLPFYPLFLFLLPSFLISNICSVGINYGTLGNNLPSPKTVAQLLQSTLINKVKIYDTNPDILHAFSNTGIDLIVSIENENVAYISNDKSAAEEWFNGRVSPFLPATSVAGIALGNDFLKSNNGNSMFNPSVLVQAMQNIHSVLVDRGLDRKILVTTPHTMAILSNSFPPSTSTFSPNLVSNMIEILDFLSETGAPFMINLYPYFAYRDNPSRMNIEYALLGNGTKVRDPKGYVYDNMLDVEIDAVRSAINALGFEKRAIKIVVSESGWPSKGDLGDFAATPDNARMYNTRLIECAESRKGTPMSPSDGIEIFVFSLFNENKKPGSVSERNFGLFNGDGSKVYEVKMLTTTLFDQRCKVRYPNRHEKYLDTLFNLHQKVRYPF
ncbi:hypothetical protein ACHQM5_024299 [Ranunculus cassubicifolius]